MKEKRPTIERLKTAPFDIRVIARSDKLSNIRTLDKGYIRKGEEVWNRFRMKDKEITGWYSKGIRGFLNRIKRAGSLSRVL